MPVRLLWLRAPAWVQDGLLALVVAAMQVQGTVARTRTEPSAVLRPLEDLGHLGLALLAASGLVLAVRRRWPVGVFVVTALCSLTYYLLDFPDGPGWVGLFVATYTLTFLGDGRRSLVVAAAGITVLSVGWLVGGADVEPRAAIGWVFFRIGASVMSAALGESVRSRRVIAAEALARAELAERTREEEARARVDAERLRIAREVHDTVAHAIAIINVQSGVTAHVLDKHPERARETLEAIAQTSSRALGEMRAILGVLRDDDEGRVPHPGLEQVADLMAKAADAGLDVELRADPQVAVPGSVPSAVGSAAYRIVQESLTNVIRHAGPTRVLVTVQQDQDTLTVAVVDDGGRGGTGASGRASDGHGRGIVGMRERCELLGGRFSAGPLPEGGFEVRAQLPVAPAGVVHA